MRTGRDGSLSAGMKACIWLCTSLLALLAMPGVQSMAEGIIPEEAIRFRVIAHSDSIADQWIKHRVRDAVLDRVQETLERTETIEEARAVLLGQLPDIERETQELLAEHGFAYGAQVTLAQVPFPTKQYGNVVYPAGQYEALRIVLGEGRGANWWCVLFPPLCFIDMSGGEAVQADPQTGEQEFPRTARSEDVQKRWLIVDLWYALVSWFQQ